MTPTGGSTDDAPASDSSDGSSGTVGDMEVIRTRSGLREALRRIREAGDTLALVPTMGYLHEGHLSLLDRAAECADRVALSVFVNPIQFGEGEDLDRYPIDLPRDLRLARDRGTDLVYAPTLDEMYPDGAPVIRVVPGAMGDRLCGIGRPHHFQGVLTVVARLFGTFRPDVAVFGRKDYQQAVLIRRMVQDLEQGVRIEVGPLVREFDGLALSSRNVYLSPIEREVAPRFQAELERASLDFAEGETNPRHLESAVRDRLERGGGFRVEYVEVVEPDTLDRVDVARPGHVLAGAVHLGRTRLIDNVILGSPASDPRLPPPDRSRRA